MTADLDLAAPVAMTKGEAVRAAHVALTGVVSHCLDLGLEPDEMDKRNIREAHRLLTLALGYTVSRADDPEPEPANPETVYAREEAYRRDMIAAGRGHLLGG